MDAFIRCLDANSSAVIAAASAISAVATIFIAWFSYVSSRLLRWEKEKDRRSRQPVLVFADEITGNHRSLYVKNVGYGPAMDAVRTIIQTGDTVKTTLNEPLPIGSIGPEEKVYALCASQRDTGSVPIVDDPRFQARVEYDDILGNNYEISYQHRHHSTPEQTRQRRIPCNQVARI